MASEVALHSSKSISDELLNCKAHELHDLIPGPALFDLSNGHPPLFVSVLLHGNETTSWDVMRTYIRQSDMSEPKNSLVLYVGNVRAAAQKMRSLEGQPDFNRIWCGGDTPEHRHANSVVALVEQAQPRFAIDIHNNTGRNPPYSVLTHRQKVSDHVARRFSDIALFAHVPHAVITRRLNQFCPAITIEVGLPDEESSFSRTYEFITQLFDEDFAELDEVDDLAIFHTVANLRIETSAKPDFSTFPKFNPELESMNFSTVPAGTSVIHNSESDWDLNVYDVTGNRVTEKYLMSVGSKTCFRTDVIMGMYTQHQQNAYKDCVCYILDGAGRC